MIRFSTLFFHPAFVLSVVFSLVATSVRGETLAELTTSIGSGWDSTGKALTTTGSWELCLSGYTYHAPWSYAAKQQDDLNPKAWGLGVARSFQDNWHSQHAVYFLGFEDSYHHGEFHLGYLWVHSWPLLENGPRLGFGYTVFLFARHDMDHYTPLPGLLPLASVGGKKLKLYATFIPKVQGFVQGNTAYFFMMLKL